MDIQKLDRILKDFYLISGMETSILDADFHSIAVCRPSDEDFCSAFHRAPGALDICKASDIERLSSVRSSLEPSIYTCPCGITEVIVPIVRGDSIAAYLISSLGIEESLDCDKEVLKRTLSLAPRLTEESILPRISELNHLSREKINAYYNMLKMVAEHLSNDETLSSDSESIGRLVKYYVKNNLARKLTLADIAWNLHCSTVTLTEHFKAEFGITIMDYVTQKRMELSEKILIATDEPLREVASRVGFSDVEYFSRTFKRFHGLSPAAWRKANKQQ